MLLCRQFDLFGRELLAVWHPLPQAVNNKDCNFTRAALTTFVQQADEKLAGYLQALDAGDADEDGSDSGGSGPGHKDPRLAEKIVAARGKRERHKALLEELDRAGEDQVSLTDPDSRAMARMTKVGVGYNVQVAVDTKHKLIAEQEVHTQKSSTWGCWRPRPNPPWRRWGWSRSRPWPTGVTSRSRTSKPA